MRIGVLGTGVVGETLGTRFVESGNQVRMGAREASNEKASAWTIRAGESASHGTFADAASFGEMIVNCTAGVASLDALEAAGESNLKDKVLVDVSNPLDFSNGFPPVLSVVNTDSLGEQIQRRFPATRVVKALNTVNAEVMVDPGLLGSDHNLLVCGDDPAAKASAVELLELLGWKREQVIDLGDITGARAMEMYLPLWLRLFGVQGTPHFNIRVVREPGA